MELRNKTIIVTGGGSGMGREMVLKLLQRDNNVVALDINEVALLKTVEYAKGEKASLATFVVDITKKESVEELAEKIISAFGHIDGVINNAGIIQPFKSLNDTDFETIRRVFDVNFFGTLYLTKALLPHLLTRPEAHVVNISSMGGFVPFPGQTIYGASKAAIKILSEGLSSELTESNVRVTAVFPGAVFTNIKVNSGAGTSDLKEIPKGLTLPSTAVEQIIKGVEQDKVRVFVGKDSKAINFLYRLFPNFTSSFLAKKVKKNYKL